jgi:hypothetical protein
LAYGTDSKTFNGNPVQLSDAVALAADVTHDLMDNDAGGQSSVAVQQYYLFEDSRTAPAAGAAPFVIGNSGFEVTYNFYKNNGKYFIQIGRTASANHGAGAGEVSNADGTPPAVEII